MNPQLSESNNNEESTKDNKEHSFSDNSFKQYDDNSEEENEAMIKSDSNTTLSLFEDGYLMKKRIVLILSIVLYLSIILIFLFVSYISSNHIKLNMSLPILSKMFQINKEFMLIIYSLSIIFACLLLTAILINSKETNELLSVKLSFKFPTALVLLTLLVLSLCFSDSFIVFGISSLLSFLSIGIFIWIFLKKPTIIRTKDIFALIGIKMALSYFFFFNAFLSLISSIIFLEKHFQFDYLSSINCLDLFLHTILLISSILMLTHFHDMFYSLLILITQIVIAISSKMTFKNSSRYILIIIILHCLCLLYSAFWHLFKSPCNEDKENEDFFKNVDMLDNY